LKNINRLLFAFFLGHAIFFFLVFGGFTVELGQLTAVMGLSVALNKGICRKPAVVAQPIRFSRVEFSPAR
jgi:hypothetical protein